jgi:hypothetical protein
VERARGGLFIAPAGPPPTPVPLPLPGEADVPWAGMRLEAAVVAPGAPLPAGADEARFDLEALPAALVVRPWRPGDRLPLTRGDGGRTVRLGALLAAAGAPRLSRARWPVLAAAGGGGALWAIGVRRGAAAPVTPASRQVVSIRARTAHPG